MGAYQCCGARTDPGEGSTATLADNTAIYRRYQRCQQVHRVSKPARKRAVATPAQLIK